MEFSIKRSKKTDSLSIADVEEINKQLDELFKDGKTGEEYYDSVLFFHHEAVRFEDTIKSESNKPAAAVTGEDDDMNAVGEDIVDVGSDEIDDEETAEDPCKWENIALK
jgi:hypothetical protein